MSNGSPFPSHADTSDAVVPTVREEPKAVKTTVDQGGTYLYRKVIAIPLSTSTNLHDERMNVEVDAVGQPVANTGLTLQNTEIIEFTETLEEAVVVKNARVIEEIVVDKATTTRTEHISDTVRRTEVEIEEISPRDSIHERQFY